MFMCNVVIAFGLLGVLNGLPTRVVSPKHVATQQYYNRVHAMSDVDYSDTGFAQLDSETEELSHTTRVSDETLRVVIKGVCSHGPNPEARFECLQVGYKNALMNLKPDGSEYDLIQMIKKDVCCVTGSCLLACHAALAPSMYRPLFNEWNITLIPILNTNVPGLSKATKQYMYSLADYLDKTPMYYEALEKTNTKINKFKLWLVAHYVDIFDKLQGLWSPESGADTV